MADAQNVFVKRRKALRKDIVIGGLEVWWKLMAVDDRRSEEGEYTGRLLRGGFDGAKEAGKILKPGPARLRLIRIHGVVRGELLGSVRDESHISEDTEVVVRII